MPTLGEISVDKLSLDLDNFRTIHKKSDIDAVNTMIAISPDYFWGLLESLLDNGYFPTENIIIMFDKGIHLVKEGNRRVASLKILHGFLTEIEIPREISIKIKTISDEWKRDNLKVPCTIYSINEAHKVARILSLIHGKGEKAGRDPWSTVAKARHARDEKGQKELGLDLLEKYLKHGNNITISESERWSGDYNLTVLDEAIRKIYPFLECKSIIELVNKYIIKDDSQSEILLQ